MGCNSPTGNGLSLTAWDEWTKCCMVVGVGGGRFWNS